MPFPAPPWRRRGAFDGFDGTPGVPRGCGGPRAVSVTPTMTRTVTRAMRRYSGQLLYGADQIAAYLGNLSRAQVYHLVAVGRLPAFKIGRTVAARTTTLDAWLEEQEHGPAERAEPPKAPSSAT